MPLALSIDCKTTCCSRYEARWPVLASAPLTDLGGLWVHQCVVFQGPVVFGTAGVLPHANVAGRAVEV